MKIFHYGFPAPVFGLRGLRGSKIGQFLAIFGSLLVWPFGGPKMAKKGLFGPFLGPLFGAKIDRGSAFGPKSHFLAFWGILVRFLHFWGPDFWPKLAKNRSRFLAGVWGFLGQKGSENPFGSGVPLFGVFGPIFGGLFGPFLAKRVDFWQNLPFLVFTFLGPAKKVPKRGVLNSPRVRPFLGHFGFIFGLKILRSVQKPVLKSGFLGPFWLPFWALFGFRGLRGVKNGLKGSFWDQFGSF